MLEPPFFAEFSCFIGTCRRGQGCAVTLIALTQLALSDVAVPARLAPQAGPPARIPNWAFNSWNVSAATSLRAARLVINGQLSNNS
jgi:hypothetical protein